MSQTDRLAITIVGAGLVGCLLAVLLRKRGLTVQLFERRSDPRKLSQSEGRSINLVVTSRGLRALELAGLKDTVLKHTVPVYGRLIHSVESKLSYQAYGKDDSERNYSISRQQLNSILLDEAEKAGTALFFDHALDSLNSTLNKAIFLTPEGAREHPVSHLIGADGAGSKTRHELLELTRREGIQSRSAMQPLGVAYKELFMPRATDGSYPMEAHALHIWPRGKFMLMALANLDGSFTMTLYLPEMGEISFESIRSSQEVEHFFLAHFPDAVPLMPNYIQDHLNNPIGKLGTLRCAPWSFEDKVLLIGDAAHAIVPFFGQGMNAGFEDCTLLLHLAELHDYNWSRIFSEFSQIQKPNADSIADMAIENYIEMSERVADPKFLLRKSVEQVLRQAFPKLFISRYALVTYSLVPYSLVQKIGLLQSEILDQLCEGLTSIEGLDLEKAGNLITSALQPFLINHDLLEGP
jgi:kynurenine 3-monooxygenase